MITKSINPRKALNKAFLKVKPIRTDIERFKSNLISLLDRSNDTESEEFHKNLVTDFLKKTYYDPNHYINTKGNNDLVIHNGSMPNSAVAVIIETKKPTNKGEMISKTKLNTKAFQELILYYLRERITYKNLEVKHLIATNINEWFIFDATLFERLFAQNKSLVKKFNDFEEGRLADRKTEFFYKNIAEPFVEGITTEIEFTYFNILNFDKPLRNNNKDDDNSLIALFKLLSPEHLLKLPFTNDSNSLDKSFYSELLHIIGLTETKDGSKKLIGRKKEGERNTGTILEDAIIQLDSLDKINQLHKPSQYGNTQQERLFNVALELSITWINRLLFLKLLEAQLITYHKGDISYSFLNQDFITNYDDLNSLFFQVLARKQEERNEDVKKQFEKVPYLNSSLFEPTEIEQKGLFISNLKDDKTIPIYSQTVLKDKKGKKRTGNLTTLQYLLDFLDSYDFGAEGGEDIQEENKTLINASVLGLIFEKINGYKDGSFFTPGFITMYMCRETIRRAVTQKFNDEKSWNCKEFNELYENIEFQTLEGRNEANRIINSIKICDPAVGSGHFLVSALNEIIAIKNDLKVLQDRDGKRLREYQVEVVNDELIITDEDGDLFEYSPSDKKSQRIQETIFQEKHNIIENCLFGVDINPNSVKICRLRLWIELLKNSYYKNKSELETLPNIDINIKCGNSLVSRFTIDSDLKPILNKNKKSIEDYRIAVDTYRNAENKLQKREMEQIISDIKNSILTFISSNDPRKKRLESLKYEISRLDENNVYRMIDIDSKPIKKDAQKAKILQSDIQKLETAIDEVTNNKIYDNAFEWRFEFPEVLNDEGEYVGFDVVIGNPPYGLSIKDRKERNLLVDSLSKVPDFEIYYWFINKSRFLLRENGILSFIIPNSILFNVFAKPYRKQLLEIWNINEILDCSNISIFQDATVRNCIILLSKTNNRSDKLGYKNTRDVNCFENLVNRNTLYSSISDALKNIDNWGLMFKLDKNILNLIDKLKQNSKLNQFFDVSQGYIPYRRSDLIKKYGNEKGEAIMLNRSWHSNVKLNEEYKEEIWGQSITKYDHKHTGSFVKYGKHLATYIDIKYFNQKRILIREITNPNIIACLIEEEFVNDPQLINIIPNDSSPDLEFLWALLNSNVGTFYHFHSSPKAIKGSFPKILIYDVNNFPIPSLDDTDTYTSIINVSKLIITLKKQIKDVDTTIQENLLNNLVYKVYNLTEDEIEIINNLSCRWEKKN